VKKVEQRMARGKRNLFAAATPWEEAKKASLELLEE
jgi:hypothetical protein